MYNLLLTIQNQEVSLHYHTLQKISNSLINSTSNFLILPKQNIIHLAIYYLNTKHAIATNFRIRLIPNVQLITERPSKVPIHYRDELNALLKN